MQTKLIVLLTLTCLVVPGSPVAQSQREVLTNAKIIELVRLGLSEALIVAKINRSECHCDTTTGAIAKLKAAKVTDGVIMAMMNSSSEPAPSTRPQPHGDGQSAIDDLRVGPTAPLRSPSSPTAAADTASGYFSVFLVNGNERLRMKKALANAKVDSSGMLIPYIGLFKKAKTASVFAGNHSQFRINTSTPVFEVSIPGDMTASDTIALVKLEVTKTTRQLQTGRAGVSGGSSGYRKEDLIPVMFEELQRSTGDAQSVIRVKVVTPIAPGEYAVIGPSGVYDFGVDAGL